MTEAAPDLPLVSVVVPTRNRDWLLAQALDSILSQDYPNIECVVVDAESTDNTLSILKSHDDRIRWLSEPDQGPYEAINKGWAMCHGEIMTWLNADDCWTPGAVRTAVQYFQSEPAIDVLYGDCGGIDLNSNVVENFPAQPWDLTYSVLHCDHIINQPASFISRRSLEKVGFLYPDWAHDQDLWLRIAMAGGVFKAVRDQLAYGRLWRDNRGSTLRTAAPAKVALTERFFARDDVPANLRPLKARAMSNAYLRVAQYMDYRQPGEYLPACKLVVRAITADPANSGHILYTIGDRFLYWTLLRLPLLRSKGFRKRLRRVFEGAWHRTAP